MASVKNLTEGSHRKSRTVLNIGTKLYRLEAQGKAIPLWGYLWPLGTNLGLISLCPPGVPIGQKHHLEDKSIATPHPTSRAESLTGRGHSCGQMTHYTQKHQVLPNAQRKINNDDDDNALLSDLYVLIHLTLKITLQGKYCYYYFTDEESKAQRK